MFREDTNLRVVYASCQAIILDLNLLSCAFVRVQPAEAGGNNFSIQTVDLFEKTGKLFKLQTIKMNTEKLIPRSVDIYQDFLVILAKGNPKDIYLISQQRQSLLQKLELCGSLVSFENIRFSAENDVQIGLALCSV